LAIPTILVTAYPDEVVRDQALKDRVACYLRKPVVGDRPERCPAFGYGVVRRSKKTHASP
jgi:response regulator RpfG family c-di-GMP phosphodiesterase